MSILLKFLPGMVNLSFLESSGFAVFKDGVYEIPFLDRMGFVFVFCIVGMVIISMIENKNNDNPKGLEIDRSMFKPSPSFIAGSLLILGLVVALYSIYW